MECMDWSDGYVSEVDYTYGYYGELNPLQTKLKLLFAGIKPPEVKTACELGFGQGVSLLSNSAGSNIAWYGNDFNPNQVAFVHEAINDTGLSLNATDEDFERFCSRSDLPGFDFIALHGIWSWISEKNRKIISRFIAEKLNVGGVLYISYNSEPGRTAIRPFRDLMEWHSRSMSAPHAPLGKKIENSISFMEKLLSVEPAYSTAHPYVAKSFQEIVKKDRNYLAHEYFNADWAPMSIKDLSDYLTGGKLQFAASANPIELLPNINFTKDQLQFIDSIGEPIFKEYVKDFCINQDFRRDLWIKGGRRLSAAEREKELLSTCVTLVTPAKNIKLEIETTLGKASLNKEIYQPIIDYFNGKSRVALSDAAKQLEDKVSLQQIFEVCIVLAGKGVLCLVQDDIVITSSKARTDKLNAFLIEQSQYGTKVDFLTSPVTSSAVSVSRFEQMFLSVLNDNAVSAHAIASQVWRRLKSQNEKIVSDGKVLSSDQDNINFLENQASRFLEDKLPILEKLQIA